MVLRAIALALWFATVLAVAAPARAAPATLVADRIEVAGGGVLIAAGSVEVFFEGARLTATEIRYVRADDELTVKGPIRLDSGDGSIILADAAALDTDLRNGILEGARMVLDQQFQLAANRIERTEGRYTRLTRVAASSCRVCDEDDVPLWEIRARSVIHDEIERQLYFESAQLRIAGVPVAYVPRLRMPDPSQDRATGFLFPELRTSTLLGPGLRVPYFIAIGGHADVELTPYVSNVTNTLEGVYRHELSFGRIRARGAMSDDSLVEGIRSYLFADALIYLPRDFQLRFDVELVSDEAYLIEYGYSQKDRLDSALSLARTRRDEDMFGSVTLFRTLRGPDLAIKDQITRQYVEGRYERRLNFGLPGDLWVGVDGAALSRASSDDVVGRDVARIGGDIGWRLGQVIGPGIVTAFSAELRGDAYSIEQDSNFDTFEGRAEPTLAAELRWPMRAVGSSGAAYLLQPVAQVAWSEVRGGPVPNEDSTLPEFDEGNLLALSHFPGRDRTESGLRAAVGLSFNRFDANGWSLGATVGRVFRDEPAPDFSALSGLRGDSSDWLVALRYDLPGQIRVANRSIVTDAANLTKSETRLSWRGSRASVAATYTYLAEDADEVRVDPVSELSVDAAYRMNREWTSRVNWRYDTDEGQAAEAGLRLTYQTDCLGLDLSLSRRFTSSATVRPSTDFTFRVSFDGLGTGEDRRNYRQACRG